MDILTPSSVADISTYIHGELNTVRCSLAYSILPFFGVSHSTLCAYEAISPTLCLSLFLSPYLYGNECSYFRLLYCRVGIWQDLWVDILTPSSVADISPYIHGELTTVHLSLACLSPTSCTFFLSIEFSFRPCISLNLSVWQGVLAFLCFVVGFGFCGWTFSLRAVFQTLARTSMPSLTRCARMRSRSCVGTLWRRE